MKNKEKDKVNRFKIMKPNKTKKKEIKKNKSDKKRTKQNKTVRSSNTITKIALKIVPGKLTGDDSAMNKIWSHAYSTGDPKAKINEIKGKNAELFIILLIGIILSVFLIISNLSESTDIGDIERSRYGGDAKVIEGEVTAEYKGETLKKKVQLKILPEGVDTTEVASRISDVKFRLPDLILGENEDINEINRDLDLIGRDDETGVDITWESSNTTLVADDGTVNLIDGDKGDNVNLTAHLRLGEASDELLIPVTLGEPVDEENLKTNIGTSIDKLVENIGQTQSGKTVILPKKTIGGLSLTWSTPREIVYFFIPIMIALFGYYAYRKRYSKIDKMIKEDRESVARDFPDFLSKLLLLLNAGMVISSALAKIADDYEKRKRTGEERYFYEELCGMQNRIRTSNAILAVEFSELALKTGRREVMRFSAILSDNIDKGSALAEKLTQESEMLWTMRKKNAEEKGRIAETKLTFPMVLQLLVIILITIAPASMGMN